MIKFIRNYQLLLLTAAVGLLAIGCSSDDSDGNPSDVVLSQTEVSQVLNIDDLTSVTDNLVTGLFTGVTTFKGTTSNKVECYVTTTTDNGYTMTFTDCSIDGSDGINGTLVITYTLQGQESVSIMATYNDFSIGAIQISGTRSMVINLPTGELTGFSFDVTSNMTVTLEDGTVVTETGTKTLGFVYGDTTSGYTIDGNWTIKIDDSTYSVTVNTTLMGSFDCDYLTSGVMTLSKNGLAVTVDFGDGTCDNMATVTYPDGSTENINLDD